MSFTIKIITGFLLINFIVNSVSINASSNEELLANETSRYYLKELLNAIKEKPYNTEILKQYLTYKSLDMLNTDIGYGQVVLLFDSYIRSINENKIANWRTIDDMLVYFAKPANSNKKYARYRAYVSPKKRIQFLYDYIKLNWYDKYGTGPQSIYEKQVMYEKINDEMMKIKKGEIELFDYYLIETQQGWKITFDLASEYNFVFNDYVVVYLNQTNINETQILDACEYASKFSKKTAPFLCYYDKKLIETITNMGLEIPCVCKGSVYVK